MPPLQLAGPADICACQALTAKRIRPVSRKHLILWRLFSALFLAKFADNYALSAHNRFMIENRTRHAKNPSQRENCSNPQARRRLEFQPTLVQFEPSKFALPSPRGFSFFRSGEPIWHALKNREKNEIKKFPTFRKTTLLESVKRLQKQVTNAANYAPFMQNNSFRINENRRENAPRAQGRQVVELKYVVSE